MEATEHRKKIAHTVAGAIGFNPQVKNYFDTDEKHSIHLLTVTDPIDSLVKFYCTLGVCESPNMIEQNNDSFKDIPIELLMTGYESFEKVPNILSTCAFYIIKDKWECQPGTVFKRMVEMYYPDQVLKHILFVPPFLWEDKLGPIQLSDDKAVNFLLAVPISDNELAFREQHGRAALEDVFEEKQVDVFDLNRPSVL